MVKRPLAWFGVALIAAAALAGAAAWKWRTARQPPDPVALAFFEMTLPDPDGASTPIKRWQGKLLIVNFWATWCGPCAEEMPQLQKMADEFAVRNVAVLGIGVDDADKIRQFRAEHHLRFPLVAAGLDGMELAQRLGDPQPVLPYTALISPDGRIIEEHVGRIEEPELRRWVVENTAL